MMGERRHLSLCIAVALGACRESASSPTLATLDGPTRAELVRVDQALVASECKGEHKGPLCEPGAAEKNPAVLRIHGEPPSLAPATHCTDLTGPFELAADAEGRRIAYRCTTLEWYVVFVGSGGRSFELGESIYRGGILKWPAVPTFAESAQALYRASNTNQRTRVLEEAGAALSEDALAKLLVDVADAGLTGTPEQRKTGGPWAKAFAALPDKVRTEAAAALTRRALGETGDNVGPLLVRAVLQGNLAEPKRAGALRGRLDALLGPTKKPSSPLVRELLRVLAGTDPKAAGSTACGILGEIIRGEWQGVGDRGALATVALWAVAEGGHPCRALIPLLEREACSPELRCPGEAKAPALLCTAEQTKADFDALGRKPDYSALIADESQTPVPVRLALAALHRTELAEELATTVAPRVAGCPAR